MQVPRGVGALQAARLMLVQILINSKGYNMNPLQVRPVLCTSP